MKKMNLQTFVLLLSAVLIFGSCNGSSNDGTGFKSSVVGADGDSGKLTINMGNSVNTSTVRINEDPAIVDITATLELATGLTQLTGTYDTTSDVVTLSGGEYSFVGETISGGKISGDYTKSGEAGIFAGFDSTTNDVVVYCGTYDSQDCTAEGCSGKWSATTTSAGYAVGTYYGNDGISNGTLWGTFTDNTMSGEDDHGSIMTGTVSNGIVTGTWILVDEYGTTTGTFEASTESCP